MVSVTPGGRSLRPLLAAVVAGNLFFATGCDSHSPTAPARGLVRYDGEPLKFGSVMFQPVAGGQPARGEIGPDGTFVLSTFAPEDGAIVGEHRVRVMCNSLQRDGAKTAPGNDATAGQLLIPRKYTQLSSSGLFATVAQGENAPFEFDLTSDGKR